MKFLLLCLLCFCQLAGAITLDELQQRFTSQPVIRAHFEQLRQIKDFPQPLHSRGEIIISHQQGLLWQQTAPFPMTLILDQSRMVQSVNAQPAEIITAQTNPQLFQFNHLLRALFQANRQLLEQNFRLQFQDKGKGQWQLRLTPRTSPLDKLFDEIVLQGQTYLDQIELHDKQGDSTTITFSQQRLTPNHLTDDEQHRFTP